MVIDIRMYVSQTLVKDNMNGFLDFGYVYATFHCGLEAALAVCRTMLILFVKLNKVALII